MIYKGPSMHPTLKPGDRLFIRSYYGQKIHRGDVIVFISPGDGSRVVHRVVSSDLSGIRTQGDNNNRVDPWLLSHDQMLGRVYSAKRGNKRRRIFGGTVGRLFAVAVRAIHTVDSWVSFLLRPAYNELAKVSIFTRLLPTQMRPRVVSFEQGAGKELQLLMGRRVVGRWLPGKAGWRIRRPFRLFVDEETLPGNPGKGFVVPPEADPSSVADEDL
jgi:signal peptidase I